MILISLRKNNICTKIVIRSTTGKFIPSNNNHLKSPKECDFLLVKI